MRRLYHDQLPLSPGVAEHPRAAELLEMSRVLDAATLPLAAIQHDLAGRRKVSVKKGREGLSAEQVMRAGLLKQMFEVSYDGLAFHLGDSIQPGFRSTGGRDVERVTCGAWSHSIA